MPEVPLSPLEKVLAGKLVPTLVNLALVLAIAWLAAALTWQLVPAPQAAAVQRPVDTQRTVTATRKRDLAGEIVKTHLFGTAAKAPTRAPQQSVEEAPDTKLNLALRGVLAAMSER